MLLPFLCARLICARESSDSSQTPVNLRPFQLTLPRDHLFGDWSSVRSRLEEEGFTPTLSFVTDIAGNPNGGRDRGVTHADNFGLDLLFDLDKLVSLKGGSFLLFFLAHSVSAAPMAFTPSSRPFRSSWL